MRRLDFYVQHLVKHDAQAIVLTSGQPVTFRFGSGERHSNTPIDHATVTGLVQEAAPRPALDVLTRRGTTDFPYATEDGVRVTVVVEAVSTSTWRVTVTPGGAAAPQPAAGAGGPAGPAGASRQGAAQGAVGSQGAAPAAATGAGTAAASAPGGRATAHASGGVASIVLEPGEPEINRFLRRMIELGASDLHLSSDERPLVRLHGEIQPLDPSLGRFDDARLRELLLPIATKRAARDFEERNDADFAHTIPQVARFRANYFMDRKGMGAVFRQIPFTILTPEQLGIPKQVLDLCWLSKGLVLVTGPTGSGKSTTLASLIDFINRNRSDHIITIEDPIEFVHENKQCLVNQREITTHTESFKSALRAALREDPDIVLVGEMRDLETIAIAIETAETGHLVFGTLHTTTAPSTVDRIIDQFPADRQEQIRTMLSESLRGVISQMLCKKKAGGRVAAYEVLISTPAVGNLIREGKTFQLVSVMQTGRNLGMQTMNEHLFDLVKREVVDAREAYIKSNDKQVFKEMLAKANIKLDLSGG
jgi:twitching motility protein PilT